MSMTEPERHELYELAKRDVSERFAELMIKALPHDVDRLATKDDLAVLGAELRREMAELRSDLRVEMRELTSSQTRTLMLGLVGSITALTVTEIVVAAL
jgi:hypothetical protein